ncbi:putative ester cyclase [Rhodopseudomonas julia]|uniref:Ester cyclase n=1 Tax=Rhodopseudomonas julia TaxID=200617 RepID=A0ABU0C3H4_9BRAD|nr:ester cyclase [Rhodopseudomonas julia]MDQ0324797.1 putative ester cyclase [Rhodopseudomonas julia]
MDTKESAAFYRGYIDCLNRQAWDDLHRYVSHDVRHNGKSLGLRGYQGMLTEDHRSIPDLYFKIEYLVCEPPMIASRLWFDCTPVGTLFSLPVNGERVQFSENVFYEIENGRIQNVWSVIDKAAVAAQIRASERNLG